MESDNACENSLDMWKKWEDFCQFQKGQGAFFWFDKGLVVFYQFKKLQGTAPLQIGLKGTLINQK